MAANALQMTNSCCTSTGWVPDRRFIEYGYATENEATPEISDEAVAFTESSREQLREALGGLAALLTKAR